MSAGEQNAAQAVVCEVFRSPRREGMYLYVDRTEGLARVPEALLTNFGTPQSALVLRLDAQRRLANADAKAVLEALAERGFYLQMPPSPVRAGDCGRDVQGADGRGVPGQC